MYGSKAKFKSTMLRQRLVFSPICSSFGQTAIILSLLFSTAIVHVHSSIFDPDSDSEFLDDYSWHQWQLDQLDDDNFAQDQEFYPPFQSRSMNQRPEMQGLVCYQCAESVSQNVPGQPQSHMSCELTKDALNFEQFLENNPGFLEESEKLQGQGGLEDLLFKKLSAEGNNPCKIITNKILEMVESEEDNLLPIYLDATGKDSKTRYTSLKDVISSIQFQKRETSDWLAIEVQLRDTDDTFSFILPDFDQDFLNIPRDFIFYTSL